MRKGLTPEHAMSLSSRAMKPPDSIFRPLSRQYQPRTACRPNCGTNDAPNRAVFKATARIVPGSLHSRIDRSVQCCSVRTACRLTCLHLAKAGPGLTLVLSRLRLDIQNKLNSAWTKSAVP
jgi:hypothetical protein